MRNLFFLASAFLLAAVPAGGCREKPMSREQYVKTWFLATLRAREKGTEPREELEKILGAGGITQEAFEKAQSVWFGEETCQETRQGVRRALDAPNPPSRPDYIQARVRAFLRARVRRTSFSGEIRALGAIQGFDPEGFRAAAEVWVGDEETDIEIRELYSQHEGVLRVPWDAWQAITSSSEWEEKDTEGWLAAELEKRSITREDWEAAEYVHGAWEMVEEEKEGG